jgi:hypothetical protein
MAPSTHKRLSSATVKPHISLQNKTSLVSTTTAPDLPTRTNCKRERVKALRNKVKRYEKYNEALFVLLITMSRNLYRVEHDTLRTLEGLRNKQVL